MIPDGTGAPEDAGSTNGGEQVPLESLAEELRRKFLEARSHADEIHRAERDFRAFEEQAIRDERDRLRSEREAEQKSWRDELATLHANFESERKGWREQFEAALRVGQIERENARAADDRLRAQADQHARLSTERDARSQSFESLIAKVLREADEQLLRINDLRRERDDLRDEIEAIRAGKGMPLEGGESEMGSESSLAALRDERDELSRCRDVLQLALEDAGFAARLAAKAHAERLAAEQAKVELLSERLESFKRSESPRKDQLPILSRDLARWSTPLPLPAEPEQEQVREQEPISQTPPSMEDLAAAEKQVEMLRKLIRTPPVTGKPFHSLFDEARFVALQSRLREASLLAERLFSQVERSRSSKDLLWHLMVAQRTEEINRSKRR